MFGNRFHSEAGNGLRTGLGVEGRRIFSVIYLSVLLGVGSDSESVVCACAKAGDGIGKSGCCLSGTPASLIFVIDKDIVSGRSGNFLPLEGY